MLDVLGILISSVAILFVLIRAVRLDRTQPWFQPAEQDAAAVRSGRMSTPTDPGRQPHTRAVRR